MKYAVVTGSTKGIGRAVAEMLLNEGYYVIANYSHDENSRAEFERDNNHRNNMFSIIRKDLSSWEASQEFTHEVLQITDRIDCLIFSAGITNRSAFDEITREGWDNVMNVNLNVPFYIVHTLRNNISPNSGRIIFIGSICGVYPHSVSPMYGVSKAAVHQLAKDLVKFFAPRNITVNAIVPGFIDTPWQKAKPADQRKRIEDKTALHRFGRSEEVASLCREIINNQYINGANLEITGGYSYR